MSLTVEEKAKELGLKPLSELDIEKEYPDMPEEWLQDLREKMQSGEWLFYLPGHFSFYSSEYISKHSLPLLQASQSLLFPK